MNAILTQAIKKASQIRTKLNVNMVDPVNIFDCCAKLGVDVRFIEISMEGMYFKPENSPRASILISNLRPMPRRVYTCAHELGHHLFDHGSKIDGLTEAGASASFYDKDEYLVDTFAGALLMPVAGVETEFRKRKWDPKTASPFQYYSISSIFGTGYATLVTHCKKNRLVDDFRATELLKQSPAKLLKNILGNDVENSYFKIIDDRTNVSIIDLEVNNYIFLPTGVYAEGDHLTQIKSTSFGNVFTCKQPGIVRAASDSGDNSYFIRIQNAGYIGLAENRHLENQCLENKVEQL